MADNEIIKLLHLLGQDILQCRKEILRLTRTVQGYERDYQELPKSVEEPPKIIIPEEVYQKLCDLLEEEEMGTMGVA